MRVSKPVSTTALSFLATVPLAASAEYLGADKISVSLGSSMSAEPFANRSASDSLASVVDAESASDFEFHSQTTHVWVSGGQLELILEFTEPYDLEEFHFWNYTGESYDVDSVVLDFMLADGSLISSATVSDPMLGVSGDVAGAIYAEDFVIDVDGVKSVRMVFSGTNDQVDFQNVGFTGVRVSDDTSTDAPPPMPRVEGSVLRWDRVPAKSINVHDGNGGYITTLPGDATSWTAPGPGSYYLVATNDGDWRTWARSETVTVADSSSLRAPMPRVDGSVLRWDRVPAKSINVHDGDGGYITTLSGDATSWTAPGPGSYYLVATNDGDWRTWARSETVTVADSSSLRAPMPRVDGSVLRWDGVPAKSINVHDGDGGYITTLSGDATSWMAPGPGSYYLVATNDGDWRTWARSQTVVVAGE